MFFLIIMLIVMIGMPLIMISRQNSKRCVTG